MERVPYQEDHGIDPTCFVCGAAIGQAHKVGCWAELCPSCGSRLVTCGCRVLEVREEAQAVRRIYDQIKGLVFAWRFLATFRLESIMARAAMVTSRSMPRMSSIFPLSKRVHGEVFRALKRRFARLRAIRSSRLRTSPKPSAVAPRKFTPWRSLWPGLMQAGKSGPLAGCNDFSQPINVRG